VDEHVADLQERGAGLKNSAAGTPMSAKGPRME